MTQTAPKNQKEVSGYRLILGYLGIFLILIGLISALPMSVVIFFPDEVGALPVFGGIAAWNIALGLAFYFIFIFKRKRSRFYRRQETVLLMFTWLAAIISGAAPFTIMGMLGQIGMTFSDAFFEATSGYSTTGLTLFKDFIDVPGAYCSHVLTFHRALMNFIGGVGLVLLVASVLGAGGGGMTLYVSEGHNDRLLPNIAKSAKLIFGIYLFYTVIGVVALMLAGMPVFDAVCHSMSALSGGGFSPRADNVAAFRFLEGQTLPGAFMPVNSLSIEIIIMVLVTLSAISFMLHTFLLRFRFRDFFRDDEIRFAFIAEALFFSVAFIGALITTQAVRVGFFGGVGEITRMTFFYTIGCFTNSGFASTTPDVSMFSFHFLDTGTGGASFVGHGYLVAMVCLMLVGGGMGSSAGGIKQYRVAVAMRSLYYSLRYRFASPHHLYPKLTTRYGETHELDDETIGESFRYIFLFLGMFLLIVLIVLIADPAKYSIESAVFDVASAVSNTGLSWVIGPVYVGARSAQTIVVTWALSMGMLLGRLEILPAAYAISNVPLEIRHRRQQREIRLRESEKSFDYDL